MYGHRIELGHEGVRQSHLYDAVVRRVEPLGQHHGQRAPVYAVRVA